MVALLALGGCADVAASDAGEDTQIAESESALTYNSRYDVHEVVNGVHGQNLWGAAQTQLLSTWSMPFGVDEYCSSNPTFASCIPRAGHPRPAWLRVKTSEYGSFGGWIYTSDWNTYTTVSPSSAPNVVHCKRWDFDNPSKANNWFCYTGNGSPGYSYALWATYGQ